MSININHDTNVIAATNIALVLTTNATEKLRITNAGGVSFGATGTAVGTAGQVLQSNGDASPTWVTGGVSLDSLPVGQIVTAPVGSLSAKYSSGSVNLDKTTYATLATFVKSPVYATAVSNPSQSASCSTARGETNFHLALNAGSVNTGFTIVPGAGDYVGTTAITLSTTATWYKVLYSTTRDKFYAVSTTLNVIASTDGTGTSWTNATSIPTQYTWINFIEVAGTLYLFAAESYVFISTDGGVTWTSYTITFSFLSGGLKAVVWTGTRFIAPTYNGYNIGISTDGITWGYNLNYGSFTFSKEAAAINGVAYFLGTTNQAYVIDAGNGLTMVTLPSTGGRISANSISSTALITNSSIGNYFLYISGTSVTYLYNVRSNADNGNNAIGSINSLGYVEATSNVAYAYPWIGYGSCDTTKLFLPKITASSQAGFETKVKIL